ncbi:hypothetical protein ACJX0J_011462, partial [Zea mays]
MRVANKRTVAEGLTDMAWVHDLRGDIVLLVFYALESFMYYINAFNSIMTIPRLIEQMMISLSAQQDNICMDPENHPAIIAAGACMHSQFLRLRLRLNLAPAPYHHQNLNFMIWKKASARHFLQTLPPADPFLEGNNEQNDQGEQNLNLNVDENIIVGCMTHLDQPSQDPAYEDFVARKRFSSWAELCPPPNADLIS